jgi:DamX protein
MAPAVIQSTDAAPSGPGEVPEVPAAPAPERYTLQLIGFRTQTSIAAFVREHGIAGEAHWMRTPGRARDWYLVLLGDYASRQEAQEALASLPAGLRGLSPMVRALPAEAEPLTLE